MDRSSYDVPRPSDMLHHGSRNVFHPTLITMGDSTLLVVPTNDPLHGDIIYAIPPRGQRGRVLYTETPVGRSEQGANDIVLRDDIKVSRMHGSIAPIANGVRVVDHSRNGTRVREVPEVPIEGVSVQAGSSEYYIVKDEPSIIRCGNTRIRLARNEEGELTISVPEQPWYVNTVVRLDETLTFGSSPKNDLILSDGSVAPTHGRLRCIGKSVIQVTDESVQEGQTAGQTGRGTFLEREGAFHLQPKVAQAQQEKSHPPAPMFDKLRGDSQLANQEKRRVEPLSAVSEGQGKRPTMEDASVIVDGYMGSLNRNLYMVADGHGGGEAARYAIERFPYELHNYVYNAGINREEITDGRAMREVFRIVDHEIKQKVGAGTGATVVVVYRRRDQLTIGHVGDVRVIMDRGGEIVQLTHDYRPTDPTERARIERAGGSVSGQDIYVQRQGGKIGPIRVTRALGDRDFEPVVTSEPEILSETIQPSDRRIVIASDGLWDVMRNNQEVLDLIRHIQDPQEASRVLRDEALQRLSRTKYGDNVTVMVVNLQ